MASVQPPETVGIKRRAEILRSYGGAQEIRKSTVWIGRREGVYYLTKIDWYRRQWWWKVSRVTRRGVERG